MVEIEFLPDDRSVRVPAGTTVLEAARLAGVLVEAPCNGAGTCGKCRVNLMVPDPQKDPSKHGPAGNRTSRESVLACQTEAWSDWVVEISPNGEDNTGTILNHGENLALERNPFVTKQYCPETDRTVVYAGGTQVGSEAGDTQRENFGVVVDIGTTTLVASLVDVPTGREILSVSALNPQTSHGQDVLSRIRIASEPAGLSLLYASITETIGEMIGQLADETGIDPTRIYEVVYSGNTCMLHLAAPEDPRSLGKYPYRPVLVGGDSVPATGHHLGISEFGLLYRPPIVSAYVGADITSGILAAHLHVRPGSTLLVDIGTNGEMVLAVDGRMTATSTAAGPAFEGMNIACGMRAGKGAIERFEISPGGDVKIETIGDGPATGICGSGLMDIVAELVAHGVIDPNGRLKSPGNSDLPHPLVARLQQRDGKTVFVLSDGVFLSQKDIRQVQLAKGAVRAGIEYLLASQNIDAASIDRVLIAGSFGYHVRVGSLITIGLLPAEFAPKVEVVGNTSQSGGRAFLLNRDYRLGMAEAVSRISVLELANHPDFEKVFIQCLRF